MNAYTVAGEIVGGRELGPGQVARLGAIDHEHQRRLYAPMHVPGPGGVGARREPAPAERAQLRAFLENGVRGLLRAEQHATLDQRR